MEKVYFWLLIGIQCQSGVRSTIYTKLIILIIAKSYDYIFFPHKVILQVLKIETELLIMEKDYW